MEVTIIVATFGPSSWEEKARAIAIPSAQRARPADLVTVHGPTLSEARNLGADRASTEWLCFLDADDEVEPGYLEAMATGSGDLLAPSVRFVDGTGPEPEPMDLSSRNISTINPCVIGTLIRRAMFLDVEGFWHERAWEDWSLFRRAWLAGATIEHIPDAIYRVNVNPAGRNSTVDAPHALHRQILRSHAEWQRRRRITR